MPENCHRVREQLSAWLDGKLEPEERGRLSAHLEGCAACRRELARLTALGLFFRPAALSPISGVIIAKAEFLEEDHA
jgi:anti-sigma factor RsiW